MAEKKRRGRPPGSGKKRGPGRPRKTDSTAPKKRGRPPTKAATKAAGRTTRKSLRPGLEAIEEILRPMASDDRKRILHAAVVLYAQ